MSPVMHRLDDGAEMPELTYIEAERIRRDAVARRPDETQAERDARLAVHRSVPMWRKDS